MNLFETLQGTPLEDLWLKTFSCQGDYPEDETPEFEPYDDDEDVPEGKESLKGHIDDQDKYDFDVYDNYLNA